MKNFSKKCIHTKMIYLLITFQLFTSCSKFVEIDLPKDQVQTEIVFSDLETANATILGLYAQMQSTNLSITNGGLTVYAGLSADELKNTSASTDLDAFYNNTIPSNNSSGVYARHWTAAYKYIYHANLILESLNKAQHIPESNKIGFAAEARFIRAFLYHYLGGLFGDVPLIVSTDYKINAKMGRSALSVVNKQIIEDLMFAYTYLPSSPFKNNARPSKYAAAAMLARVYLSERKWVEAGDMASQIINSNLFQLEPVLTNVFVLGSKETIWQLPRDAQNTAEGTTFIPVTTASVRPAYELVNSLLSSFEPADRRLVNWTATKIVSGQKYTYPFKYKQRTTTPLTEGYVVLRLAEQYLIRAEANAQLGKLSMSVEDLNQIRHRAGVATFTSLTSHQALEMIYSERRKEFFAEWGHRWFDMKRTGTIDTIMSAEKLGWKSSSALFPIPATEILRNPSLIQNPGY